MLRPEEIIDALYKAGHEVTTMDLHKAIAEAQLAKATPMIEKQERERGRILGINQCITFIKKAYDNPTLAEDIKKWVVPHGHKAKSEIIKFNRRNP